MRPHDHLIPDSPDERRRELAQILAAGLLRALGHVPADAAVGKNPQNSAPPSLDSSPHTSVTVHSG